MNRRTFLIALAGAVVVPGYAFGYEPGAFEVTTKTVPMKNWKPGLKVRLLHLGDFHASRVVPWSMIEHAVTLAIATKPDLICMTGDFVTGLLRETAPYIKILSSLAAAAPAVACFGNHDGGVWVSQHGGYETTDTIGGLLIESGITPLKNQSKQITIKDQPIDILGFGDMYAEELHAARGFASLDNPAENRPRILMSHNPDSKAAFASWEWDLLLCGHTHGGQIKIPYYGAMILPIHDRRFAEGLIAWRGRQVHVTRGVGNLGGFRINCPPEISVLELVAAS